MKSRLYYLGVTRTEIGSLELSIFAKDRQPLVKVTLVKMDAAASSTPIHLDGCRGSDKEGVLIITVFGCYKAEVIVTSPRE